MTATNLLVQDLAKRIQENDVTLSYVSLRRLPLFSISAIEVALIVQALTQNQVVDKVDLWLPTTTTTQESSSNEDDSNNQEKQELNYDPIITTMLSQNNSIRTLSIASCGSDNAWKALFVGLQRNTFISDLELGDSMSDMNACVEWNEPVCQAFGKMLRINTSLRRLTLRGFSLPAQISIAAGLQACKLHYLELHQMEMDPGTFGELIESCHSLHSLYIIDCDLGLDVDTSDHPWTTLLSSNTTLKSLRILECQLTQKEVQAMARGMKYNQTLQVLDLRGNELTDDAGLSIAEMLQHNESLTKLILEDTEIGNQAVQAICCQGLCHNQTLQKLNLRCNQLSMAACESLALLPPSSSIRALDLSENKLGDGGATILGELLSRESNSIQELLLEATLFSSNGIAELVSHLHHNTSLVSLNLGQNILDVSGATAVANMLRSNKTLSSLNLSFCHITNETIAALAPALTQNNTLAELFLGFNNIGNDGCQELAKILPQARLSTLDVQFNTFDAHGIGHLLDGLVRNVYLTDLFVLNAEAFCDEAVELVNATSHWLALNRAGRRAVREDVTLDLWPSILEKADGSYGPNAVYCLLQSKPDLVKSDYNSKNE